jgi:hypothetical protein
VAAACDAGIRYDERRKRDMIPVFKSTRGPDADWEDNCLSFLRLEAPYHSAHSLQCPGHLPPRAISRGSTDLFWLSQNYRDLEGPFMGPLEMGRLKPRAIYVVVDHTA